MRYESYRQVEWHRDKEKEQSNQILVLTGLSGSGKDYLLGQFRAQGRLDRHISVYSFGSQLFEAVKQRFPELTSRDQLRDISDPELIFGINRVLEQILREQPVILNTHTVHKQGDCLSCRPDFDRRLDPASYVFVWTDPEQIVAWRQSDRARERASESVEEVALNQSIALVITAKLATMNQSAFHTLENRPDNTGTNLDNLSTYLEEAGL